MPSLNTENAILSNAIKVNSSYNVGIGGAASGGYKLNVTGTSNFTGALTASAGSLIPSIIAIGSGSGNGIIQFSSSSNYVIGAGTDYGGMEVKVGGSQRLLILNNGNVGINQSNPTFLLDVNGTARVVGAATFSSSVRVNGASDIARLSVFGTSGNPSMTADTNNLFSITGSLGPQLNIGGYNGASYGMWFQVKDQNNTNINYPILLQPLAGAVAIGTVSPLSKLDVRTASAIMGDYQTIQAFSTDSAAINLGGGISLGGYYTGTSSIAQFASIVGRKENGTSGNYDGYLAFGTNAQATGVVERMRITSGGEVFVGCTSDPNASVNGIGLYPNGEIDVSRSSGTSGIFNRNTTNGQILDFRYNNTQVGSISTNSNSLPSDLNFKKDITDISIGLNLVIKLRPVHYRHKMDEDDEALSNGIIAQELEQALLDCGVEKNSLLMLQHKPNEKEGESQYWVDYTKMIPVLIKSIQEQQAQIEELKELIKNK